MKRLLLLLCAGALVTACGVSKDKYNGVQSELEKANKAKAECETRLASVSESQQELEQKTKTYSDLVNSLEQEIKDGKIKISEMKDRLTVNLIDKILFDSGSVNVKSGGKDALGKVAAILKDIEGKQIQVEGHTDNVPVGPALQRRFPTNWELSTTRATAVVRYLSEVGVPSTKLSATGYGMFAPIASNDSPDGRSQNRRIEIVLVPELKTVAAKTEAKEKTKEAPTAEPAP